MPYSFSATTHPCQASAGRLLILSSAMSFPGALMPSLYLTPGKEKYNELADQGRIITKD